MIKILLDECGDVREVISHYSCANVSLERLGDFWTLIIEAQGDIGHSCAIAVGHDGAWVVESESCSIKSPPITNEKPPEPGA
jgi:hypothetical protein